MVLKHYEHVLPGQMSLEAAGQKKVVERPGTLRIGPCSAEPRRSHAP